MALILAFHDRQPAIAPDVFVAPNATIIGDVSLAAGASVWYGAVIRGDAGRIVIGARTSVQDNVVIHVNAQQDTLIGADVTIGHGVVLEGCTIEDGALVGMNATILSGAHIGAGALVAAGAVVREGQVVPPHTLVAGVPARSLGALSAETRRRLHDAPLEYQKYSAAHRALLTDDDPPLTPSASAT